jgi:predicted PurR-regulated permease PerM
VLAKAVGLHPAVSIIALLVGAELLGVWGALFAAPVAGLLQVLLTTLWQEWRQQHPIQFPQDMAEPDGALDAAEATATPTPAVE